MKNISKEFDFIRSRIEIISNYIDSENYSGASFLLGRLHAICTRNTEEFNQEDGKDERT